MAVWESYAKATDQFVDAFFGEKVRLLPYVKPNMAAAFPDSSRKVTNAVGVEETMRTNPMQLGGMTTRVIEADLLLSIRREWVDASVLAKGDRVQFIERNNTVYEVTLVEPEATDRPRVHLVRINE